MTRIKLLIQECISHHKNIILQKSTPQGAGGSPKFFHPKSYFFCDLQHHKILEPYDNSFWEKSNGGRKREEKKRR